MSGIVEGYVTQLGDSSLDSRSKLNVVVELRDSVEMGQITADSELFVSNLLPVLLKLLEETQVSMQSNSTEHKIRNCVLDTIYRLQPTDALEPQAGALIDLATKIIKEDNEENGVLCMKFIANIFRFYKTKLSEHVVPFIQLIITIIEHVPAVIREYFDNLDADSSENNKSPVLPSTPSGTTPVTPSSSVSLQAGQNNNVNTLCPAISSLKVLMESPIIMVVLANHHRQLVSEYFPTFVPRVLGILTLEAKPQADEHARASEAGTFFTGVSPVIRNSQYSSQYTDLITVQIKFISFIVFVIRSFAPILNTQISIVPSMIIRLLKDCPPHAYMARKELLVALRHIVNTEHRRHFVTYVNLFLEERILIGSGLTAKLTLRPLAYNTVAELVHHVRSDLSPMQIWRTVDVFLSNLNDPNFGAHFQSMCVRLLLNILDRLSNFPRPEQCRYILLLVLLSVTERLKEYNEQMSEQCQIFNKARNIIHTSIDSTTSVKDCKVMTRNLLVFSRSLAFSLKASNPPALHRVLEAQWQDSAKVFGLSAVEIFRELFKQTLAALKLKPVIEDSTASKEYMDAIVAFFMQLDTATFTEIFGQEIEGFVDSTIETPVLLHLTYLLTGNEATSASFCAILLDHLMDKRLKSLGESKGVGSPGNTVLKLFKQCFSAVNLFPTTNELVILPHLKNILVKSLEYAKDAPEPSRYFALLQSLFRTLGGGRFDNVYKTVLPLLHYLLDTLNHRLASAKLDEERDAYAELCLTVPVRLSLMVPHLNYLMKPLVQALSAKNTDLVAQGLRTLELCVDNLTASYFDPHIEPVLPQIIPALYKHLKPLPYDHKLSHTTLRVLGKLGGRSRAYASSVPADFNFTNSLDQDLSVSLTFEPNVEANIRVTPAVQTALRILDAPLPVFSAENRRNAYRLLSAVLLKHIPTSTSALNIESVVANMRGHVRAEELNDAPPLENTPIDRDGRQMAIQFIEKLLDGIFCACGDPELREEAFNLLVSVAEHIMLLDIGEFNTDRRRALRPFNVNEHEGRLFVPQKTFVNAIVNALSHYNPDIADAALDCIRRIHTLCTEICTDTETHRYPLFRYIFAKVSHSCFDESWYVKRGAVRGMSVILKETNLSKSWLMVRVLEISRTFLFVIKDTSGNGSGSDSSVPNSVANLASDLLLYILENIEHKPGERYFSLLTSMLAFELESSCPQSRLTAKKSLSYIAKTVNKTVSEILVPVTDVFLTPIYMKPLRALPFAMQVGYIDAISFCLELPDTFLKFDDKFNRMIEEALALVDAEDESLTSAHRVFEYTTNKQLTELRSVCIKMLSQVVCISDTVNANAAANNSQVTDSTSTISPAIRARILACFFKTMINAPKSAVDAAYEALKSVLVVSPKLPKELLQSGLKPILLPLSEFKRLNVGVLDCLTRLLELLNYNFRVEIGTKLLTHLRTFAEPTRLYPLAGKVLANDDKIAVGVALVNVFHMLPPAAHSFIAPLVTTVNTIEQILRRIQTSPFREPLAKFLSKYPKESYDFFLERLGDQRLGAMFSDMVDRSKELHSYTSQSIGERIVLLKDDVDDDTCMKFCNLVRLVGTLKGNRRDWLSILLKNVQPVVSHTKTLAMTSNLHLDVPFAVDMLQKIIAAELTTEFNFEMLQLLVDSISKVGMQISFDINSALWMSFIGDTKGLSDSERKQIDSSTAKNDNAEDSMDVDEVDTEKKDVEISGNAMDVDDDHIDRIKLAQSWLDFAVPLAADCTLCSKSREFYLRFTNVLLLYHAEAKGYSDDALLDLCNCGENGWVDKVHKLVWLNTDNLIPKEGEYGNIRGSGLGSTTLDWSSIQFLSLSVLMVKYASTALTHLRKDVIKFGWRYIVMEDIYSKVSAYVLITHFIAKFETIQRIVVQIYMALLKTSQTESRPLVQQCLDELATVLPQRLSPNYWARGPRLALAEDGHGVVNIANVCLFLAKHTKMFYPYRESYMPFIVSAMARLSHMSNQALDIDLAELITEWEQQAHEESNDSSKEVTTTKGYTLPHSMKQTIIIYLVRFITAQPTRTTRDPKAAQRVLTSLDKLLSLWPDVTVELTFFDRALLRPDLNASAQSLQSAFDALRVVETALRHCSGKYISEHASEICLILERPLHSNSHIINELVISILSNVMKKDETETVLKLVLTALSELISPDPNPANTNPTPAPSTGTTINPTVAPPSTANNSNSANNSVNSNWVGIASEAIKVQPNCIDDQMSSIIKALSKMAKDFAENGNGNSSVLIQALKIVTSRISVLGDQRRAFLTLLAHIGERVQDTKVSHFVLETLDDWVFGTEAFPTIKEKAALLLKLQVAFTDATLVSKYFDLIVGIFNDPKLRHTELPARLEQPFLIGCMTQHHPQARKQLLRILNDSIDRSISKRLVYVLQEQNWEAVADQQWLAPALAILLAVVKVNKKLDIDIDMAFAPVEVLQYSIASVSRTGIDVDSSSELQKFIERCVDLLGRIDKIDTLEFIEPLLNLITVDPHLVNDVWIDLFPNLISNAYNDKERTDLLQSTVVLLSKEYNLRQCNKRPNVVQTILTGLADAKQMVPPQLTKYLATSYSAWFPALQICESMTTVVENPTPLVSKVTDDTLAELYAALGEDDFFYGHWRSKSKFPITAAALSYEQCGMWSKAMHLHETAQLRARSGALPFGESEYNLWEDHWILCAEKLQHWEILADIARHEGFTDLLLECQWRLSDWLADRETLSSTIRMVMDVPTPRREVFQTFLSLQGSVQKPEALQHLSQNCDEGIQLTLSRWHALPETYCHAHDPLLHTFQQFVEFMEAAQVYTSLQATTVLNLESKSQELKGVMQAWHDRLPNIWDDINMWSDLAAWRQHVFGIVNRVYLPLVPQVQASQSGNGASSSAAYRGYHEIAWTINRFAHTARKQGLPEVCITQLSKIYTLPNIEIQEAFLKLREQAKCHLQNPKELATGLDVIANTNLVFFGNPQKSEFFALKGESLAKLGQYDHANSAFSTAVQIDVYLAKAWASWGHFNDSRYQDKPDDASFAAAAAVCYLHAAGLYKNHKSRKLLGRLLWLLAVDDKGGVMNAFNNYKSDTPTWFWISYIPQLITALSQREAKYAAAILSKIAKSYPQAVHFHLRTAKEEYAVLQRLLSKDSENKSNANAGRTENRDSSNPSENMNSTNGPNGTNGIGQESSEKGPNTAGAPNTAAPWAYTDEIMNMVKTAYPLLALSLETLVDQLHHRFKSPGDEDAYRLIVALLNDGLSYLGRQPGNKDEQLPANTQANVNRFAESVIPEATRPQFEADFVNPKPTVDVYIQRLRKWRNRLEAKLDSRPYRVNLEALSPPLGEFHYQKFEDIEIPGQSMDLTDDNHYFRKITRFVPSVDLVRSYGICYKRIAMKANDGSTHRFAVQFPAARNCRREERVSQVFKALSKALDHSPQTRRRNLKFNLPNAVPLNMYIRMVQDDEDYISFYQIYEKYCKKSGISRDAPFDYQVEKLRLASDPSFKHDITSVKMEILSGIQSEIIPSNIMENYFKQEYRSYDDFWRFRRQFSYSYAVASFMVLVLSANNRYPHKFHINLRTGQVWASDMLPLVSQIRQAPTYLNGEPVAFRLTPNLQTLMGPTAIEGVFAPSLLVIAKALTNPEFDLHSFLPVFIRDEVIAWFAHQLSHNLRLPNGLNDKGVIEVINSNVDAISNRAISLLHVHHNLSVNQSVLDLISLAVNPKSLAVTDILWMPYF